MAEWFEDPTFWENKGPFMFHRQRLEGTPEEVDGLLSILDLDKGAHILDLCCGPGRHAAELVRRGFRVTGVDRHKPYLERAREASGEIELVEADMRDFSRAGAFDAVINMYTSFGYFEDPAEDLKVARNMRASLKAGGKALIETVGKEVLARKYVPRAWHDNEDGSIMLERRRICDDWSGAESDWILFRGAERSEHRVYTRLYSAVEIRNLLQEAGFGDVTIFGALDGRPYDHEAKRLVAVSTRDTVPGQDLYNSGGVSEY